MKVVNCIIKGIGFGLWITSAVAAATSVHSLAAIEREVETFLRGLQQTQNDDYDIQVNPLDPRLRLAACDVDLEVFLANGARALGNTSVGVRCSGSQPWTVYLSARIHSFAEVLVAGRYLPRGTLLTAADLRPERRDTSKLAGGYATDPAHLLGKRLRRSLREQAVIPPQALEAPKLVRRGNQVTLVIRRAGMEITAAGIALDDGTEGERIQVRNAASERVIEGEVIDAHRVEVNP